jgi:CheY-like chemotaxis protein
MAESLLSDSQNKTAEIPPEVLSMEDGKIPHILVVEDERHIARLIEYFLVKAGYSVATAESAEIGLESAKEKKPDAVILDLTLPGMSGLDFLGVVRNDPAFPHLKVIVVTAHWFGTGDQTIKDAGANALCSKPVSPTNLIKTLTELGVLPPATS